MAIAVKRAGHDQKARRRRASRPAAQPPDPLARRARGSVRGVHVAEPRAASPCQCAAGDADPEAGPCRARPARRGVHRPARPPAPSRPRLVGADRIARTARERCERGHARLAADDRVRGCSAPHREASAPPAGREAGHARHRRAVHHDDRHQPDLRPDPLAADPAVPALRLPPCRRSSQAQQKVARPMLLAVPGSVHRRRPVRLLRGPAGGRALLRELQRQPVQRSRAGQPVLPLRRDDGARDGPAVPDPDRDPHRHAGRDRHDANCSATIAATRSSPAPPSRRSFPGT